MSVTVATIGFIMCIVLMSYMFYPESWRAGWRKVKGLFGKE